MKNVNPAIIEKMALSIFKPGKIFFVSDVFPQPLWQQSPLPERRILGNRFNKYVVKSGLKTISYLGKSNGKDGVAMYIIT